MLIKYKDILEKISAYKKLPTQGVYTDGFFNHPEFYLDRTRELLGQIGLVGNEIKLVHIAGTSGKGTMANLLTRSLQNSGLKVGLFTSPPLQVETERFVINGNLIALDEYSRLLYRLIDIGEQMAGSEFGRPSFGEINTVLGYQYFIEQNCDLIVIEALAGGQFDATNVFENKLACVLTRVGLDHMHMLGDTTEKIAIDKAHIVRQDVPLFVGEPDLKLQNLISTICVNEGAVFHSILKDGNYDTVTLATAVCNYLGVLFNNDKLLLPGRLEEIKYENSTVVLDGAHNQQKVTYLIDWLKFKYPNKNIVMLLGASSNKNSKSYLVDIMKIADVLHLTTFYLEQNRRHSPKLAMRSIKELEDISASAGLEFHSWNKPIEGFKTIISKSGPDDIVVVTGSMFLVGVIRDLFYPSSKILTQQTTFPC